MKIGIVNGSIRVERRSDAVAAFVQEAARKRAGDVEYVRLDLVEFDVPLLTTSVHPMAAAKSHDDANVQRWSDAVDACDGFVFVTPEYNHGVPGGFKNAVDSLGPEWVGRPVAVVGHGTVGGVRAIEQWRQIVSNFSMPVVRAELNFNMFIHWEDGTFSPEQRHDAEAAAMLDELEGLVTKIRV